VNVAVKALLIESSLPHVKSWLFDTSVCILPSKMNGTPVFTVVPILMVNPRLYWNVDVSVFVSLTENVIVCVALLRLTLV